MGHCSPNLALIPKFKDCDIYYIGSVNGIEREVIENSKIKYYPISTVKLKRSLSLDNLYIPVKLYRSYNEAKKVLTKICPDVVFSKGGYVSLPVTLASKSLNIPVICHESDLVPGLANKLASPFCEKTLTAFKETAHYFKKGEYVGPIIRSEVIVKRNLYGKKPTLLVIGGSSGAKAINEEIRKNLDEILKTFNVYHVTGKNNLSGIKKEGYTEKEFVDMKDVYPIIDFAISRCGANTAFELIANKIPTVFIPLPKVSSRGDQIKNAEYFENKGLSLTLPQENLTELLSKLEELIANKKRLIENMDSYSFEHTTDKIEKIIRNFLKK